MRLEKLQKEIESDEGVFYKIYRDHLGFPTFGIGHLIVKEDPEFGQEIGTPVSKQRVDEAFKKDVEAAINNCKSLYSPHFDSWPDEVQEILINMVFNLGKAGLGKFKKFKEALIQKNWKQAGIEGRDSLWYKQVKNRAERLMQRLEKIS